MHLFTKIYQDNMVICCIQLVGKGSTGVYFRMFGVCQKRFPGKSEEQMPKVGGRGEKNFAWEDEFFIREFVSFSLGCFF